MQIKLLCGCGTKFTFDVEPVNGRMPTLALCPSCGVDCTEVADGYIAQVLAAEAAQPAPAAPSPPPPPPSEAAPGSNLRVTRTAHTPPPQAPPAPAAPKAPVEAPKASGLSVSRKAHEPAKPEPEAAPPVPVEVVPEDDSFEARRAKRLAESHNKVAAGHQEWGKTVVVIKIAAVFLVALAAAYGWYAFVGSAPKIYYTAALGEGSYGAAAKLFSPDELVVADGKSITLHDLKTGQTRWTLSTKDSDSEDRGWGYTSRSRLHVTAKDIWAVQGGKLRQIDPVSGAEKKTIPVAGQVTEFAAEDNNLVVISDKQRREFQLLLVNLATAESKTETIAARPKKEVVAKAAGQANNRPATAGNLLRQELDPDDERTISAENTLFAAAGDHAVRVDVTILKTNITRVKVMRDAAKQSKLNAKTSASSNPFGVAEEVFNDIKRSDGGQFSSIDESTYAVTVNRLLKGETAAWQGEISGKPTFYAGKSVDLVIGYKEAIFLTKDNKVIAKPQFEYPIGALGGLTFRRPESAPFLETADTLYFWDKGSLTAFDLPSGNKRWNFKNVGITSVVADEKGGVYVCGSTASPDSIQYSEDIKLENRPRAQFLKLDARTGKQDWDCKEGSKDVYLTGKFLYTTRPAGNTLGMMAGNDAADHIYIHRVNPRNGQIEWELDYKDDINQFDVLLNRIAIVSRGEVKVFKFLSL